MEAGTAGFLHGAETLAEGALAFTKTIYNPTAPLKATFKRIRAPSIPRSSHTVSVIKGRAYIFGGEIAPRQPVDNAVHMITLPPTELTEADYQSIPAEASSPDGEVPPARVGHSAAVIDDCIYVFGGRGGASMGALEERGRVWVFDTTTKTWSHLDPDPDSQCPLSRSYHTSTALTQPLPRGTPNIANVLLEEAPGSTKDFAEPPPANSYGTFFIHAGCLSSGGRTSDVWGFDLSSRSWSPFPSAPDPARGGTNLVIVRDRLYRFGGFDGKTEQGGQIDFLDLNINDTFDDHGAQGQMALSPRGKWRSTMFATSSDKDVKAVKNGHRGYPTDRSVCGLVPVTTGQGRDYLLIICGEGEASTQGHAGAGRFLDDVWSFQLKPEGGTTASFKDATREFLLKKETGETDCVEVQYLNGVDDTGADKDGASFGEDGGRMVKGSQYKPMGRRGWMACSPCDDAVDRSSVLLWGGVGQNNERLGDGWIITVE